MHDPNSLLVGEGAMSARIYAPGSARTNGRSPRALELEFSRRPSFGEKLLLDARATRALYRSHSISRSRLTFYGPARPPGGSSLDEFSGHNLMNVEAAFYVAFAESAYQIERRSGALA